MIEEVLVHIATEDVVYFALAGANLTALYSEKEFTLYSVTVNATGDRKQVSIKLRRKHES